VSLSITEWLLQLAVQFSYLGVFLVSLLGAMAIVVPIPYTLVIFWLGQAGWDPLLLMISGGAGSAIGELAGYLLGYYGRRLVSEKQQKKMDYLLKILGKYSPAAIFLFALTPLPDDLLFIPLGMLRYNVVKAFIPALFGKLLMAYLVAYFGKVGGDFIIGLFGDEGSWIGALITSALLIIGIVILYRIDWERVLDRYVANQKEGIR
jgi:membrane protein DedA with SNARE-associated domain